MGYSVDMETNTNPAHFVTTRFDNLEIGEPFRFHGSACLYVKISHTTGIDADLLYVSVEPDGIVYAAA